VLGGGLLGDARIEITYGPLSLAQWRVHATPAAAGQRAALFPLLLPAHLSASVTERWRVSDTRGGARLVQDDEPSLLGVYAYLGTIPSRRAA
jgi:hypothetical protein